LAFVVAVVALVDESLAVVVDSPGYVPDVSPGYVPDDEPLPPPSHAHAAPAVDRARASAAVTATSGLVVLFIEETSLVVGREVVVTTSASRARARPAPPCRLARWAGR
jgi:hypothetical protein